MRPTFGDKVITTQVIEFLGPYTVKDAEAKTYKKGEVIEMPYASAQHFLTRNLARIFVAKPKAAPEPVEESEPEAPKKRGRPPKLGL